jgi:hypothetical protein
MCFFTLATGAESQINKCDAVNGMWYLFIEEYFKTSKCFYGGAMLVVNQRRQDNFAVTKPYIIFALKIDVCG